MYKSLFFGAVFLFAGPIFVSADAYSGPYCFEKHGEYGEFGRDINNVRGTCKKIEIKTIVSLDSTLRDDYLLGTHTPVEFNCERGGFCDTTKYSEYFFINNTSSIASETSEVETRPLQYAVFDKKYFTQIFSQRGIPLAKGIPDIRMGVFNESEFRAISDPYDKLYILGESQKPDVLSIVGSGSDIEYRFFSYDFVEHGKHVYAPKGELIESQYADFEGGRVLSNTDLQIELAGDRRAPTPIVSNTSPLKSVKNYWLYTKKNGKLALVWQKTEYGLDNGKTKIVTPEDKNITASLLLGDSFTEVTTATPSVGSEEGAATVVESAATSSDSLPTEPKKGFFSRLLEIIRSWFN